MNSGGDDGLRGRNGCGVNFLPKVSSHFSLEPSNGVGSKWGRKGMKRDKYLVKITSLTPLPSSDRSEHFL